METLLNSKSFFSFFFFLSFRAFSANFLKLFITIKAYYRIDLKYNLFNQKATYRTGRSEDAHRQPQIYSALQSVATDIPETIQTRFPGALVYIVENVLP